MPSLNKTHKKAYYKQHAHHSKIEPTLTNLQGFIISTDQNREKNALKEAYNFLNEYCDTLYPDLKQEQEQSQDVQQGLEQELEQLKTKNDKIFYQFQTGIKKGIVFIKISDHFLSRVDPTVIYNAIMLDVHRNKKIVSKNCHRLIPIQKAVKNDMDLIKQALETLVIERVDQNRQVHWMCQFKSRFQQKIKKQELYDLCGLIMAEHQVNYKEPEYTIYVEVNKTTVYLSILQDYVQNKKCALHSYEQLQKIEQQKQEQRQYQQQDKIEKRVKQEKEESLQEEEKESPQEEEEVDIV